MSSVPATEAFTSAPPGLLDDPEMASACAAAVDELEIAARLETLGVSNQVASETYGRSDVFDLAGEIYANLPFDPVAAPPEPGPAPGGLRNLGRGVLFVVPTLLFAAAQGSLLHHLTWWSLSVGVTVGWSLSQLVPAIGWPLRGRQDHRSDALVAVLSLVAGAAIAGGLAFLLLKVLGGAGGDVVAACVLCAYMVGSALLLLGGGEKLLALALAPGLVLIALHYLVSPARVSGPLAGWSAVATVGLVVLLSVRGAVARRWRWPRLQTAEWRRAGLYALSGLSCGVLISALIAFGDLAQTSDRFRAVAICPLLLSLGLMEWELSSYRHDSYAALTSLYALEEFARHSRRSFLFRFGLFAGALLLLCLAAESVAALHHSHPDLLVAVEGVLGIAFFLGLVVEAAGHVGQTLVGRVVALLTLGAVVTVGSMAAGGFSAQLGIDACLAGGISGSLCLMALAWRIVASPFSY
jgi:hypothetical protein